MTPAEKTRCCRGAKLKQLFCTNFFMLSNRGALAHTAMGCADDYQAMRQLIGFN